MAATFARPVGPGIPGVLVPAPGHAVLPQRAKRAFGPDFMAGYTFAAPLLVLLLGLIGWPFLQALWMSFFQVVGPRWGAFVGLRNYTQQLEDPIFRRSFVLTVQFVAESVAIKFQ